MIAKLRMRLEPRIKEHGLNWTDVVGLFDELETLGEVRVAYRDPAGFMSNLTDHLLYLSKKVLTVQIRPTLEPWLQSQNLSWSDVAPILSMIDSVEDIRAAYNDPVGFMLN